MRCVKPFVTREAAFGCGQCMPCRLVRRRTWTHRIMLESLDHADNSFVTLTYSDESLPKDYGLVPEHLRNWFKRLRKRIDPIRVRYYAVGEYGDVSNRPHYHVALFGWPSCQAYSGLMRKGECECPACSVVRETWNFGHTMCAPLEVKSAQYIAGYVMKKMTRRDDIRLHGRHPEFSRMSLMPGIGATAMWNVASEMMRYQLEKRRDVPLTLDFGKKSYPLGKYLRSKLRTYVDSDEKLKKEALQEFANRMQFVREFAWSNNRSVASVFEEINEPYAQALEGRLSINRRGL